MLQKAVMIKCISEGFCFHSTAVQTYYTHHLHIFWTCYRTEPSNLHLHMSRIHSLWNSPQVCKHIIVAYITVILWLCEIKWFFFYIWMCCEDVAPPSTHTCEGHESLVHNTALFILSKSVNKEFQSKLSTKKTPFASFIFAAQWYRLQFLFSFTAVADRRPLSREPLPAPVPPLIRSRMRNGFSEFLGIPPWLQLPCPCLNMSKVT